MKVMAKWKLMISQTMILEVHILIGTYYVLPGKAMGIEREG